MTEPNGVVSTRIGTTEAGKYKLVRLLGAGGMGEVYEAQHEVIGRRFAIKFLLPEYAGCTEIVTRFQREAQAAGSLENENIAAVVDTGTADDGVPYLVMEYLDGSDLAKLLKESGPLPVPRAAYITIQACRGLAAAHARMIVHRDLKPANLFVCKRNDGSDQVKVLDFGIAKLHTGGSGTDLTHAGAILGTPDYMSPEQARGAKEVDHRTDIYALGAILYETLSGTKPHPGEDILCHVMTKEPEPLGSLRGGLPPGLVTAVHKALARDAEDRYASVVELMAALIPFSSRAATPLRGSPVRTVPPPVTAPNTPAKTARLSEVSAEGVVTTTPRAPSRRMVLGGVAAAGVLAVVGVLWFALGYRSAPHPISSQPVTMPVPPSPAPPLSPPAPPAFPVASTATPPTAEVESPPARPPERPPGQRSAIRPAVASKPLVPNTTPTESSEDLTAPRRKLIRSIDRQNPFAE